MLVLPVRREPSGFKICIGVPNPLDQLTRIDRRLIADLITFRWVTDRPVSPLVVGREKFGSMIQAIGWDVAVHEHIIKLVLCFYTGLRRSSLRIVRTCLRIIASSARRSWLSNQICVSSNPYVSINRLVRIWSIDPSSESPR